MNILITHLAILIIMVKDKILLFMYILQKLNAYSKIFIGFSQVFTLALATPQLIIPDLS